MRDNEMQNCPICGARLAKKLVEDITNSVEIERCPDRKRVDGKKK